ncbi:hypothetical protein DES43_1498 [Aquamicrobium defluvii]|uniref:Uncharacterized protein n=1 Tax=Aquamicrobium defluvii TaxID=69279 RepID=A0A4R6Y4P4_9HYPH|nr:hypothetical protein DES43_1498 [Aquamicrobium defluvii]
MRQRRDRRRRWRQDALHLLSVEGSNAYYEAQRRATRARLAGDRSEFFHWAKVAAEVARLSPEVEMDIAVLRTVVAEEENRPS